MNRSTIVIGALACLVMLASGCSRSRTYSTPEGKVTVKREAAGKSLKLESKEGTWTAKGEQNRSISEAELGIPVYPGAKVEMEGKFESEAQGGTQVNMKQHVMYSPDTFDKVVAFYKAKLKNVKNQQSYTNGGNHTAMFNIGDGDSARMVLISREAKQKRTMIQVMKHGLP